MIATLAPPLLEVDRWTVHEMSLTVEKLELLWAQLQKYRTLFSDLTLDDPLNFIDTITAPRTMWFEVREHGVLVGIIWFGEMDQVVDCTAHMMFFDRRPAEKLGVCKAMMRWMFDNFPLRRISVTPPAIYHALIRLLEKMGFRYEGCKRETILLRGTWHDMLLYGITKSEVDSGFSRR